MIVLPGRFLSGGSEGVAGGVVLGVAGGDVLGVSGGTSVVSDSGRESGVSESESLGESSDGGEGIVSNCAARAAMSAGGAGVSTTID